MIDLGTVRTAMAEVVVEHEMKWYAAKEYRCFGVECEWKGIDFRGSINQEHAEHVAEMLIQRLAILP